LTEPIEGTTSVSILRSCLKNNPIELRFWVEKPLLNLLFTFFKFKLCFWLFCLKNHFVLKK
jgi:hypothetical protein